LVCNAPKLRTMMHQTQRFKYLKVGDINVIALPYKHNDVIIWMIMPDNAKTALQPIIKKLTVKQINQW